MRIYPDISKIIISQKPYDIHYKVLKMFNIIEQKVFLCNSIFIKSKIIFFKLNFE